VKRGRIERKGIFYPPLHYEHRNENQDHHMLKKLYFKLAPPFFPF
jgi:hypothetical protein